MTTSYLAWVSVAHAIVVIGFAASLISGLFLIYLNLFCIKKVFGTYKYLMIIFTTLGIVFATLEVVLLPNMHSFNSATLYFTLSKPFGLSKEVLTASLAIYTGFYSATICMIAIQFLYRYWAVFDEPKLDYFQSWYSLIWIVYVTYFGAQWAIGAHTFVRMDHIAKDYLREEILLKYNATIEDIPSQAFLAFDPKTGDVRWWNIMTIANMSFIMSIQYGIMIYCGYLMYTKMEEKLQNFSTIHKTHHKQLFKTLLLQIGTPTFFLLIPLSFIIYIPLFQIELSIPTGVLLSCFSLYPAVDSIVAMYVVAEYRQRVKNIIETVGKKILFFKLNRVENYENTTTRIS